MCVARRMLAYCLHTLRRIGSRADRPLSRSLTCRPRASLPRSCRSFGPFEIAALKALQRPSCCSVRNSCVPAILSVRMHMHRSSKIMLFCVDWRGGGAAGWHPHSHMAPHVSHDTQSSPASGRHLLSRQRTRMQRYSRSPVGVLSPHCSRK